jgi:hypothetical protein
MITVFKNMVISAKCAIEEHAIISSSRLLISLNTPISCGGSVMMNPRERVYRALRFEPVDRAPRDLWALLGVKRNRKAEHLALLQQFPLDITFSGARYGSSSRASGTPGVVGSHVDAFGCVRQVAEPGVAGEVKEAILDDDSVLAKYQLPWEILHEADFSMVNANCAATDRFVRGATHARPFERMQFLRGTEKLFLDMAYGSREFYMLRDRLHDFFLEDIALWCKTDVDCISFMDDWGAQSTLLISQTCGGCFLNRCTKSIVI